MAFKAPPRDTVQGNPCLVTATRSSAAARIPSSGDSSKWLLVVIAAMAYLPGLDVLAKSLADELPPLQIAFSRFAFQAAMMTAVALVILPRRALRLQHPHLLFIPGVSIAAATLCLFAALVHLPVADALAIFFVEPLLLTLLAVLILGERIGWRRVLAILAGLVGAILVIRPNFLAFGLPALYPLGTALFFSFYVVISRRLVADLGPAVLLMYTGYAGTAVLGVAMLAGWGLGFDDATPILPALDQWIRLAGIGFVATTGHLMLTAALRHLAASHVAPFQYLEIVSGTVLGYAFFGDFPDLMSWLGIGVIVGSGLFVYWRESSLEKRIPPG